MVQQSEVVATAEALLHARRKACADAQLILTKCLVAEGRAEWAAAEAERNIARETEAASDPSGSDELVEAFAAWLPEARRRLEEARYRLESLQAETARARAGLTACRVALESAEKMHASVEDRP